MFSATTLLEHPLIYKYFQALFSGVKTEYLRKHLSAIDHERPIRILDLGCGPGTNADLFLNKERYAYIGIDLNPDYIREASKNFPLEFRCLDITSLNTLRVSYDVVLLNSVIHHLSASETKRLLDSASNFVSQYGECLILDMVCPEKPGLGSMVQQILIRLDRGSHCRTVDQLRGELSEHFFIKKMYSFKVKFIGILLWELRLFVCSKKKDNLN
jgi:SAM-dependent methyltransferase